MKRKKVLSKIFLLVAALMLISCCFFGSTFARYISKNNGTATLNVAKWDVKNTAGSITVSFDLLSPSKEAYESTPRTCSTEKVIAATIENNGDVDALISLTADNETLTNTLADDWGDYSEEIIKGLFEIKIFTNTINDAESATEYGSAVNVSAKEGILYIYVQVTWTSDDETIFGEAADARDTWVGENISSVGYKITFTAVQN